MLLTGRIALLTLLSLAVLPAFCQERLIALTFDDGPRPYVLLGTKPHVALGLLDVLDQYNAKGTFFVTGWRLTPNTWGEPRSEKNIGVTCIEVARQVLRRGHEIEDHTFSHLEMRTAERTRGEEWVLSDVERGARAIQAVSGVHPKYVRPPDWVLPSDVRRDLQRRGYRILTISNDNPLALRDVNSLDYLCAGANPRSCPLPSLAASVLRQIDQREKRGVYTHILAFHELSTTTAMLPELLKSLKARGYRFVTLDEYMKRVGPIPPLVHINMLPGLRLPV